MPTTVAYHNGETTQELDPDLLRSVLEDQENQVWIDVVNPSHEQVKALSEAFEFDADEMDEALKSASRPHVETHPDYYFLVFNTASCEPGTPNISFQPIYLFVGLNFLVTVHKEEVCQIGETIERWRHDNDGLECRVGTALHTLLDALVDEYLPVLDEVADFVDEVENDIFRKTERDPVQSIFELKKNLLLFRRVVAPERDVLNILLRRDLPIFTAEDMPYVQDLYNRLIRLAENIDLYRDLLSSAMDSYMSAQSNRLNEIIKVLTVASIILMMNALIAGIYGMNFDHMPELHWRFGYGFALLLMLGSSAALVAVFKRKGWI